MNDIELGWVAGIIEGEGTFFLKSGRYPRIAVQMTDSDVLERLLNTTGVGTLVHQKWKKEEHHKETWVWSVQHSEKSAELIRTILPLLCSRRAAKASEVLRGYEDYQEIKGNAPPLQKSQVCLVETCERMAHSRRVCKSHHEYYRRRNWEGIPTL